jgi:hypothetical protein
MTSSASLLLSFTLVQWTLLFLLNKPDINGRISASIVDQLTNALHLDMPRTGSSPISASAYRRSLRRIHGEHAFIWFELPKSIRLRIYEFLFGSGKSTPQPNLSTHQLNPSIHHLSSSTKRLSRPPSLFLQ